MKPSLRRLVLLVEPGESRDDEDPQLRYLIRLASRLDLALHASFVENRDLLRGAALPFTRQLGPTSAKLRPLDPEEMRAQLRGQAEQLRRALDEFAQHEGIPLSFRVERGALDEIVGSADASDLLALGPRRKLAGSVRRVDRLLGGAGACLLLAGPVAGPVEILFDASPAGEQSLEIGLRVARDIGARCDVLWVDDAELDAERRERVATIAGSLGAPGVHLEDGVELDAVPGLVRAARAGLVVAPIEVLRRLPAGPGSGLPSVLAVR